MIMVVKIAFSTQNYFSMNNNFPYAQKRFDEEYFKIWHALLVYKKIDAKHTPFTNCRLALAFLFKRRVEYVMIGHLLMI